MKGPIFPMDDLAILRAAEAAYYEHLLDSDLQMPPDWEDCDYNEAGAAVRTAIVILGAAAGDPDPDTSEGRVYALVARGVELANGTQE